MRQQVVDGRELQDWIPLEGLFQEGPGHCGRPQEQGAHVQPQQRRRQQAGRGEDGEAAGDARRGAARSIELDVARFWDLVTGAVDALG